ncbi:hypothetical protein, partial [Sporolactobacillus inulinus]
LLPVRKYSVGSMLGSSSGHLLCLSFLGACFRLWQFYGFLQSSIPFYVLVSFSDNVALYIRVKV